MAQNGRFMACWAKFFAEMLLEAHCRANFFAEMPVEAPCWASFLAGERERALCWAKFFVELLRNGCVGRSLSRASSRGGPLGDFVLPRSRVHHAPLDLGLAPAPTCRAHQPPGPSASGPSSHPSTAFPRDFSHFAENATHPYI